MEPTWKKGTVHIATWSGVYVKAGYVHKGLGMTKEMDGSPKDRRPPLWSLVHLGSGHRVAKIKAHMIEAFDLATKIADIGDWTFDGLEGWKNQCPDLVEKLCELRKLHPAEILRGSGSVGSHSTAAAVFAARNA